MRYTKSKTPYLAVLAVLSLTALADRLQPESSALEITISATEAPNTSGSTMAYIPTISAY